jgi:hypothetical protein
MTIHANSRRILLFCLAAVVLVFAAVLLFGSGRAGAQPQQAPSAGCNDLNSGIANGVYTTSHNGGVFLQGERIIITAGPPFNTFLPQDIKLSGPGIPTQTQAITNLTITTTLTYTFPSDTDTLYDVGLFPGSGTATWLVSCEPTPTPPPDASGPVLVGSGGGTVSTGGTPTASDPVTSSVIVPAGVSPGTVTISEGPITTSESGYTLFGQQVQVTVTTTGMTAANPLAIEFKLDGSIIPPGQDESTVAIFKDGTIVPDCDDFPGGTVASPDPCVTVRLLGADLELVVLTSTASTWNFAVDISPVGGVVSLTVGSDSGTPWTPFAFGLGVMLVALTGGAWYARRRWFR